jgi:hypothetical protein
MVVEEKTLETDRLADFLQFVEDWRERWEVGERAVYRGHTDFNRILIAKLFRKPCNHILRECKNPDFF